ncbi:DMT family transporter [Roseateles sp. LYH14W]|uniref:DMT family transporter n=1 Tax=Pelomonas parva TaxID=3299032 RepID=A0ABW7F8X1_9BURK
MSPLKLWERSWLLLATGVALGLSMPLGKLAGEAGVGALSFALMPAGGAALLLTVLAWRQSGWPADPARLLGFGAVAGLLGNAIPNTLTAWLSHSAGAGLTGLAYTLPPVFTLGLMLLFRWERWQELRVVAVLLGLTGAIWLVSARVQGGTLAVGSALLLLAVPMAIGAGNVFRARYLPPGVSPLWMGAAAASGAFAWLLPAWLLAPASFSAVTGPGLTYLFLQVLMAAIGLTLFFQLQLRSEPVTMSFVGYVIALTAVLSSTLLLGEHLPPQLLPAAALIGSGFWLIQRKVPSTKASQ